MSGGETDTGPATDSTLVGTTLQQRRDDVPNRREPEFTHEPFESVSRPVQVAIVPELTERIRRDLRLFRIDFPGMQIKERGPLLVVIQAPETMARRTEAASERLE